MENCGLIASDDMLKGHLYHGLNFSLRCCDAIFELTTALRKPRLLSKLAEIKVPFTCNVSKFRLL